MAVMKDKLFSTGTKFCKLKFEKRSRCTILITSINSNTGSTRGHDSNSWFGEKNRQIRQEKKCYYLDQYQGKRHNINSYEKAQI